MSFSNDYFAAAAALYCHICLSKESWHDCSDQKESIYAQCPPTLTVCYKTHRVLRHNGSEIHYYQKGCGSLDFCNGKECVRQGQWCQVNCCNADACNKSTVPTANYITCVLVGLLTAAHPFGRTSPLGAVFH